MFFENDLLDVIARGSLLSGFALAWIILLVRLVGLRSFSKMTNFDFVVTIATGSLLAGATQTTNWTDFAQISIAIGSLFAIQYCLSRLRKTSEKFEEAIQNRPVLLLENGVILEDALRATRVARHDLIAKLREANVRDLSSVRAVILETTGDVSVLHGDQVDEMLLVGVKKYR